MLHPALESSAQDRCGSAASRESHKDALRAGAPLLWRLEELGVFTWRRLQGVLRPLPVPGKICLIRKMETDLLTGPVAIRQGGDGFKLKEGRLRLDRRKKFFTMRVVTHWHRLP